MSMKLLVLGLLMEKERHPYEIRQTITQRNWHVAFKLNDGSLYYAVDQMRNSGWIEAVEVISLPGDRRPDKTVYRITERGKEAFIRLLNKQMAGMAYPQHPMFAAMPFLMYGDAEQTIASLKRQMEICRIRMETLEGVIQRKKNLLPVGSMYLIKGIIRFSETELDWLEETLVAAESGHLFERGS